MKRSYLKKLVAVFGQPVAENPTGVMQEAAFAALHLWCIRVRLVSKCGLDYRLQKQ